MKKKQIILITLEVLNLVLFIVSFTLCLIHKDVKGICGFFFAFLWCMIVLLYQLTEYQEEKFVKDSIRLKLHEEWKNTLTGLNEYNKGRENGRREVIKSLHETLESL